MRASASKDARRRRVQEAIIEGRDLSPVEAGALLGVSVKTIYRRVAVGSIRHYRVGRAIRIPRALLDRARGV